MPRAQTDASVRAGLPASGTGAAEEGAQAHVSLGLQPLSIRLRAPHSLLEPVDRMAILGTLRASPASLVLLCAAAGCGKTTILARWAEEDPRPGAWLQLAADDDDPLVLLSYLGEALKSVARVDARFTRWLRLPAAPLRERILPALCDALQEASPFLLVLDDAQLLTSDACWEIVELLLSALPPGAQLALASRAEPHLPLARLQAAGALLRLDSTDLAFDVGETATLLRLRGLEASEQIASELQAATEGWATGLQLALLAGRGRPPRDWLDDVSGRRHDIARYLMSEVLERQRPGVRSFLLQTSILDRLSGDLCRAVTGKATAGAILRRLARDNVFLASLDESDEWYRFHHLFAELLRSELAHRDEGMVRELNGRAAAWYEAHGQAEEALRHWLAAGESQRAGAIFCRAFMEYSAQGRLATLYRWLDLFSDEEILADASLTLTAGLLDAIHGHVGTARPWISAALRLHADDGDMPDGSSMRALQAGLRAGVARDGLTRMCEDAEDAVALAAEGEPGARAGLNSILGAARWLSGRRAEAREAFLLAAEEGSVHNLCAAFGGLSALSLIAAEEGHWDQAETYAERAKQRLAEEELGLVANLYSVPLAEERVLAHRGDPASAERVEIVTAAVERHSMAPWLTIIAVVALAEIALDRRDHQAAGRWIAAGRRTLRTWPDAGILQARLDGLERAVEQALLIEPLTPAEHRVLELLPTELSRKEIAARLGVSPETVHAHGRALYRKLEAHARGEAVARARELGLLEI